jgi:aspartyl-tRNA(Asn)/glutamyl-tRNA(Gln) amidotransferase subunit A
VRVPAESVSREAFVAARERLRHSLARLSAFTHPALAGRPPVAGSPRRLRPGRQASGIAATVRAVSAGEITAQRLTRDALDTIECRQPELNAFAHVDAEGAVAAARTRDGELINGARPRPLHGVPVSVTDVLDVAGLPTRAGCDGYLRMPAEDAPAVARLRAAGAVILGKTVAYQFALGLTTPQSANPHDVGHSPGGSSGGAAVAVATGMGLASLGTDTRASLRLPAALCGVVGIKATYGSVPADGMVTVSWTMDHVGPMARSVADAAIVLDVLADGARTMRAVGAPVSGMRLGVPEATLAGAEPAVRANLDAALDCLRAHGCVVLPLARPSAADLDDAAAVGLVVSRCEAATVHRHLAVDRSSYWPDVLEQLREASATPATDYLDALRLRGVLRDELLRVAASVDALAMPTTPAVAPPAGEPERDVAALARNVVPWSLLGVPALTVPTGTSPAGLPTGLQLVGVPGAEAVLVALASAVESGAP